MSRSAYLDVAGGLEQTIALALPPEGRFLVGPLVLAVRRDAYEVIRDLFEDPRCTEEARALVREYLSGRKDGTVLPG